MGVRTALRPAISALLLVMGMSGPPLHALASFPPLYSAGWVNGLSGWQPLGDSGWTVSNGMAMYTDRTGAADLAAPYHLGTLRDFAVEAGIERIGGPGASSVYAERGYGVFVRGSGKRGANVGGGFFHGGPLGEGYYPQSGLDWGGDVLRGSTVALHAGFNTFRLEVHGNHYAVSENGVVTAQATVKGFHGDRVGIFSRQYRIRVRSFRVVALSPGSAAGGPAPALLARLASLNLQPAEVPAGFSKDGGEYYTNKEIAVQENASVAAVQQSGRLLSFLVQYGQFLDRQHPERGKMAIDATIVGFRSPQAAQSDYDDILSTYGTAWNRLPAPGMYGVHDFLATDDWESSVVRYHTEDLVFVRGTYRVSLRFVAIRGTVPDTLPRTSLETAARAIDARLVAMIGKRHRHDAGPRSHHQEDRAPALHLWAVRPGHGPRG